VRDAAPGAAAPPSEADRRACPYKACKGTMTRTRAVGVLGSGEVTRLSDGTVRPVGTARAGWTCDQNPAHMLTDEPSRSEVVRSRM
jgi:hypothetical protein